MLFVFSTCFDFQCTLRVVNPLSIKEEQRISLPRCGTERKFFCLIVRLSWIGFVEDRHLRYTNRTKEYDWCCYKDVVGRRVYKHCKYLKRPQCFCQWRARLICVIRDQMLTIYKPSLIGQDSCLFIKKIELFVRADFGLG